MQQRTIPNTEVSVSRLCLGTMTFGSQATAAESAAMVDCCLEHGVNFLDTANAYNLGESERILGNILKGRRAHVVLASKVCNKMGEGADEQGLSRSAILKNIDDSLRRLQTDYVDIYYLHQPDYKVRLEETLETMDGLIRAGKVRHLGASNYASWQLCRMLWLAERNGWQPVRIVQPMYNLIARGIEQELLPMCKEFGITTAIYNPLAGGLLTGKHTEKQPPATGTRFDRMSFYRDRYWYPSNFEAVQELSAIAAAAGRSLLELAFSWLLHHSASDVVILGASRIEQLQQNLAAAEKGPLAPETVEAINQLWQRLRGVSPQYNR